MALALGTNVGFVTIAPTADPAGSNTTIDGSSVVVKDTSPAGAIRITQIGWYRGSGTNTANFEIALYSESAGVAATRLFVDATNSSASGGWITVAVDWAISPSTPYWLGLQMDAHSGSSSVDSATPGGSGSDVLTSQTTLNDPYGGGTVADAAGMYAIYALTERYLERSSAIGAVGAITVAGEVVPAAQTFERSASIDATGAIDTSGNFFSVFEKGAALDAAGSIETSGIFFSISEGVAALDAVGTIATSGEIVSGASTFERAAAIDAVGSIEASGFAILERSASINAVGAVDSAVTFFSVFERAVSVDTTAGIATAGQRDHLRSTSVNADASITVSTTFFSILERSAALDAVGDIVVSGIVEVPATERSASLDAVGSTSSSGLLIHQRSASVNSLGSITVTPQTEHQRGASLSAIAGISSSGSGVNYTTFERSTSLSALATVGLTNWKHDHYYRSAFFSRWRRGWGMRKPTRTITRWF
jgi:hypothetical protein